MAKEVEMVCSEVVEAITTMAIGVVTLLAMVGKAIMAIEVGTMAGMAKMAVAEAAEPLQPAIDAVNQGI